MSRIGRLDWGLRLGGPLPPYNLVMPSVDIPGWMRIVVISATALSRAPRSIRETPGPALGARGRARSGRLVMVESMVRDWVDRYVQAWSSNDAKEIGELFAEDGRYRTAPFREAWEGRQAIVDEWLGRKDDPGTWAFTYDVLAVADDVAFVQGETAYTDGDTFSNLWVVRLDPDGRSREFTEWWMEQK